MKHCSGRFEIFCAVWMLWGTGLGGGFCLTFLAPDSRINHVKPMFLISDEKALSRQVVTKMPAIVKSVASRLAQSGYEAYIFGGAIRDIAMGREPKDWDIETNAPDQVLLELFREENVQQIRQGVLSLKNDAPDGTAVLIDISTIFSGPEMHRGIDGGNDANECSFNHMKLNTRTEKLSDPLDGLNDLKYRRISIPVEYPLDIDGLFRILKNYVVFQTEYGGFEMDSGTLEKLEQFAGESDFTFFFQSSRNWKILQFLFDTFSISPKLFFDLTHPLGLLDRLIFPELKGFDRQYLGVIFETLQRHPQEQRFQQLLRLLPRKHSGAIRLRFQRYSIPPERIPLLKENFLNFVHLALFEETPEGVEYGYAANRQISGAA